MYTPDAVFLRRWFALAGAVLCLALAAQLVSWRDATATTREEWGAYLQQSPALGAADKELNETYRRLMRTLPPEGKKSLLAEQRSWIARRDAAALAAHPKGSPEYTARLAEMTAARCAALRARLASPGKAPSPVTPQTPPPPAADRQTAKTDPQAAAPAPVSPAASQTTAPPALPVQQATQDAAPASSTLSTPQATSPVPTAAQPRPAAPEKPASPDTRPAPPQMSIREPAPVREKTPVSETTLMRGKTGASTAATHDLNIAIPEQKSSSPRPSQTQINITPAKFSRAYNTLAHTFKAAPFPLVPTDVSGNNAIRTEHYQVQDGIALQFKYTQGLFEKPDVISFIARQFMTGSAAYRDSIACSLVTVLKTLSDVARPEAKASDEEIFGFMRTISQAFTSDTSRVWKNNGLVYVMTYMKKTDLFTMTISLDSRQRHAAN